MLVSRMIEKSDDDQYSPEETEQRVKRALKGAFDRSAVPLKTIPRKPWASRRKAATAKKRKKA